MKTTKTLLEIGKNLLAGPRDEIDALQKSWFEQLEQLKIDTGEA